MTDIVWEEPPAHKMRGRRSQIVEFVAVLETNPGKWAFYKDGYSQRNANQSWKTKFPHIEWAIRRTDNGTYGVWARAKTEVG